MPVHGRRRRHHATVSPAGQRSGLLPAGGEPHRAGVEVDVGRGALGAAGVAGELVLVARPGPIGDLLLHARRAPSPRARSRRARCACRARSVPQSSGAAYTDVGSVERAHVGEQRAHLVVDDQRVARRAAGGGEQDRLGDEQVVVEHVDERLEQPADAGLVDRRGGDDRVGGREPVDRRLERPRRGSRRRRRARCRRRAGRARSTLDRRRSACSSRSMLFWAMRSVSWRVEDGLPVPALMTTRRFMFGRFR